MSTADHAGIAVPSARAATDTVAFGRRARIYARVAIELWPRDRGVAELRWAALTLAIMATLGGLATLIDPVSSHFVRVVAISAPASILLAVAGWGRSGARIARSQALRLGLGPFVLIVALLGVGAFQIEDLSIPAAGPLVVLAMAFAALTPGYPIAA
ncbi:MAG TPA: hypothetical protein VF119_10980, partial [Candidatus Limnocylindrales bacterium]